MCYTCSCMFNQTSISPIISDILSQTSTTSLMYIVCTQCPFNQYGCDILDWIPNYLILCIVHLTWCHAAPCHKHNRHWITVRAVDTVSTLFRSIFCHIRNHSECQTQRKYNINVKSRKVFIVCTVMHKRGTDVIQLIRYIWLLTFHVSNLFSALTERPLPTSRW